MRVQQNMVLRVYLIKEFLEKFCDHRLVWHHSHHAIDTSNTFSREGRVSLWEGTRKEGGGREGLEGG